MTLGKKIRQLRQNRGWSLAELAKRSKVALSTLSRIETSRMTGTLESHIQISRALGVRLAELHAGLDPAGAPAELRRAGQALAHQLIRQDARFGILTESALQKRMLPMQLVLPPKKTAPRQRAAEGTEKFLYLLQGQLQVTVGEERFELKPGDSLYFHASAPHELANPGSSPATALVLSSPPTL